MYQHYENHCPNLDPVRFTYPELSRSPINRGFWTDKEAFELLALKSVKAVKTLQARDLLRLSKFRSDSGQWQRAWRIPDLMLLVLLQEIAEHYGVSIEAASMIMTIIWKDFLNEMVSPDLVLVEEKLRGDANDFGYSLVLADRLDVFISNSTWGGSAGFLLLGGVRSIDGSMPTPFSSNASSFSVRGTNNERPKDSWEYLNHSYDSLSILRIQRALVKTLKQKLSLNLS